MILQNTIFIVDVFRIKSYDSLVCYFVEPKNKIIYCHSKNGRREFSRLSFELALTLSLQRFGKIPFPDSTIIQLKVLIAECVTLESQGKKRFNVPATEKCILDLSFELALTLSLQ